MATGHRLSWSRRRCHNVAVDGNSTYEREPGVPPARIGAYPKAQLTGRTRRRPAEVDIKPYFRRPNDGLSYDKLIEIAMQALQKNDQTG